MSSQNLWFQGEVSNARIFNEKQLVRAESSRQQDSSKQDNKIQPYYFIPFYFYIVLFSEYLILFIRLLASMLDVFAMSGNVQVALANTSSASKYHTPLLPVGNFSTSTQLPPPLNFNDRFLKNEPDDVGVEEKAKLKEEKRMRKVLKRERREQELKEK